MYIQKIKVYVEIRRNNIMVKKIRMKVVFAAFAGVLFLGGTALSPNKSQAAKKVSITKSVKVYEGKTAKIKLSNNKKKVTWSVIKGNSLLSLTNESKKGVTVKAYDAGTAKVRAKIGSKKYVCTVTIKVAPDANAKKGILTSDNLKYWGVKDSGAVVIPEGVKEIGNDVFAYSEISSVKLPKTLKVIGQNAFASCEITSIKLPDSLKTIGDYAFTRTTLKSIEIPDTVSEMGDYVFYSSELESVKLSSGLKKLGKNLFDSCDMLTDVTIPDGVTYIADDCFIYCSELSNVKLPSSLKELGEYVFHGCSKLKDITLPDGLTTIGDSCFFNCGINSITIPDSVTNISNNPFDSDMKITWKGTTYEDSYDFIDAFKGQS